MTSPFLITVVVVAGTWLTFTLPAWMAAIYQLSVSKQSQEFQRLPHVVLRRAVSKLRHKDIGQLSTAPSLLAEGVVGVEVGFDSAQAAFEVVWFMLGVERFIALVGTVATAFGGRLDGGGHRGRWPYS